MHITEQNVVSNLRNVFILNRVLSEPKTGCEQCQVNACTNCFKSSNILNFPGLFLIKLPLSDEK